MPAMGGMIYRWCLWACFANLFYTAILNIKGADYCYIISANSKREAANSLHKADLKEKSWTLKNITCFHIYNG